jgi:hypothetical protein
LPIPVKQKPLEMACIMMIDIGRSLTHVDQNCSRKLFRVQLNFKDWQVVNLSFALASWM